MPAHVDSTHPSYDEHIDSWVKCRTVAEGSEAVKAAGSKYLPKLTDQSTTKYNAYKSRALFFEATTRTVNGLVGMLFAKEPIYNMEEAGNFMSKVTPGFITAKTFLKDVATEVVTVGRVGLLVDVDKSGDPYIVPYTAEHIINWRTHVRDGEHVLTMVVLHEVQSTYEGFKLKQEDMWRVLTIDADGNYAQELYRKVAGKVESEKFVMVGGYPINPTKRGKMLKAIPFHFINANGTSPDADRPPLLGMANINLSHYMNSADLEHGRHFTGLPTAWVAGFPVDAGGKLKIGADVAWVSPTSDARAGFLEFTGQGLGTLENALKEKQDMMVILGARMLESPKNISESADNQASRKQGETGILSNIADSLSDGITAVLKSAAEWSNIKEVFSVEINKHFVVAAANPQLLAQLIASVQGGLMSFETFFYNLKQMGMIPDGLAFGDEQELIDKNDMFPNDQGGGNGGGGAGGGAGGAGGGA